MATGLIIIFGGLMVIRGELAVVGGWWPSPLYIQRFFDPVRSLTMQYGQLQRAIASGRHIFEILDTEPQVVDRPDAVQLPPPPGRGLL